MGWGGGGADMAAVGEGGVCVCVSSHPQTLYCMQSQGRALQVDRQSSMN